MGRGLLQAVQLLVGVGYSDRTEGSVPVGALRPLPRVAERDSLALCVCLLQQMPEAQAGWGSMAEPPAHGCEVLLKLMVA